MNMLTFCEIKYMNGLVFLKALYKIGVGGFKILARTPVPKLLQSYPPPHTHTEAKIGQYFINYSVGMHEKPAYSVQTGRLTVGRIGGRLHRQDASIWFNA